MFTYIIVPSMVLPVEELINIWISRAAINRYVGAAEIENGVWNVYYRGLLLGYMDEKLRTSKETYLYIIKIKV